MNDQFNFIETKEYRKFVEFCDSCAKYRYIGICHGIPGVGKTAAARYYSKWDIIEDSVKKSTYLFERKKDNIPDYVLDANILFITSPAVRPTSIHNTLASYARNLGWAKETLFAQLNDLTEEEERVVFDERLHKDTYEEIDLVIVDEVDRLKTQTIEILRDIYNQNDIGLVLIGMSGIEKRLSRYPQLYSRVGFSHEYKKMGTTELKHILEYKWHELGLTISYENYDNYEAVNSIIKLSNGNFRLVQRLFSQIERIMGINNLEKVTTEVVQAARESLIIGTND